MYDIIITILIILITKIVEKDIDKDSTILKVCNYYGITLDELMSKSRLRKIVDARNTLYYIFHKAFYQQNLLLTNMNKTL